MVYRLSYALADPTRERKFSKEEPIKIGFSKMLVVLAAMGMIGNAIPAGYNLGVLNTPQAVFQEFCNKTFLHRSIRLSESNLELIWGAVVSIFLFGAMIGSAAAGYFANRFGRKITLLMNTSIGLVSVTFFAIAKTLMCFEMLLLGRLTVGFFSGMGLSVAPMYLMECSPLHLRGIMGVLQTLGLTSGIIIAQILGQQSLLGTREYWPILLSLYGFFITFGLVLLAFCPESPSYLYVNQGDESKASKALERIRGISVTYLQEDVKLLMKERKTNLSSGQWNTLKVLKSPSLRIPLALVCALHAGQQFSGISAIFYYSTNTFEKAGMSLQQSQYGSIGLGFANVFISCVAVPLIKYKRRTILLSSIGAVIICQILLTLSMAFQHLADWMAYVTIGSFATFVCMYGFGLGPIPYMIGTELFQQGPRAIGMGLGCMSNWLGNLTIAIVFPILQGFIGEYVFVLFSFFMILLFSFIYFKLPETLGVDPTEVSAYFEEDRKPANPAKHEEANLVTSV